MIAAALSEQFEARGAKLPGSAELEAVRRAALARFGKHGLPGRALETWHYTDLARLADARLDFIGPAPEPAALAAAERAVAALALDAGAPRCVFVDGHFAGSLSSPGAEPGLVVAPLAERPASLLADAGADAGEPAGDADASPGASETPDAADLALASLNTAFASDGALIRVTEPQTRPVALVFVGSRPGVAPQLKLRIELAARSEATLIEHFVDLPDAGEAWLNLVTDVEQGESSVLTLYRLQQHGPAHYETALTRARLARGAKLTAGSVELGGRLVRNEYRIALSGAESEAHVFGLALTRGRQHCDTRVAVDHRAPRTLSRQDYRAIADDSSRSVFNGKVTVREDAQHIDARQRNDNLLLSGKAEIDTKPELEIYADQVICSHGATVGELSEEQLFYLRSRGVDLETARGILTTAFADVILARIGLEPLRELARDAVMTRLPRPFGLE